MTRRTVIQVLATSLRARLAIFLGIAILPLGLIAVQQTFQVADNTRVLTEQEILSRTLRASSMGQRVLREAFGAAEVIGVIAVEGGTGSPDCARVLTRLLAESDQYVFAGYLTAEGVLACSAGTAPGDPFTPAQLQDILADPRDMLSVTRAGAEGGASVVSAGVPVLDRATGAALGLGIVSVPHSVIDRLLEVGIPGLSLALINGRGQVLTGSEGIDEAYEFEAFGIVPSDLDISSSGLSRVVSGSDGRDRLLTLAPLVEQDVFVLGIWDDRADVRPGPRFAWVMPLFPILMWCAAVTVAFLSLERLVLRHLRALRGKMAGFSPDAPTDSEVTLTDPTAEFAVIAATFNKMVRQIQADRRTLSQNLAEKELLLREVHHRVKNNLQLIASILNIQIRNLSSPREQRLLRRVQDRVMSLSDVQTALYEGTTTGRTRADRLLGTVVAATLKGGLPGDGQVTSRIETVPVTLDSDQAVPMVLLAAEAVTNAIKYVGRRPDGSAEVVVFLSTDPEGEIELRIGNSVGIRLIEPADDVVQGLGTRLIEGFAAQLGGSVETVAGDDRYDVVLRFKPLVDYAGPTDGSGGLAFYGSPAAGRAPGGAGQ